MTDTRTIATTTANQHVVPSEWQDNTVSPMLIFGIIRRKKFSIVFLWVVLSALTFAAVGTVRPTFLSTASVLVQERSMGVTDVPTGTGMIATDTVAVRTQADILRSNDLARSVVRRLDLIDTPEFALTVDGGWQQWLVSMLRPYAPSELFEFLGLDKVTHPPTLEERESFATALLLDRTSIANDGRSYVIDIKVKLAAENDQQAHRVAVLASDIANAYADEYAQFTGKIKADAVKQANGFFDDRIAALRTKMLNAERDVQNYRAASGLIEDRAASTGGAAVTLASQRMAQLNADLSTAITERTNAEAKLQQVMLAVAGSRDLRSVPEIVSSPLIQRLREQQITLSAHEAALALTRGSGNPELMAVRGSEREVATQLAAETNKIANSLRSIADAAHARETALRGQLAELRTQVGSEGHLEIKLLEQQSQADIAKAMYTKYLTRYEETANQLDVREPDALIVSRATPPLQAAPPSKKQLMMAGITASLALSVLLALVRVRLEYGFRTAEELEANLGVTTLGYIPKLQRPQMAIDWPQNFVAFSEAIFSIRSLLSLNKRGTCQVVMITSALPQEGKTFFASSLARNAAQAGQRVLLMDCDLRRPTVAKNIAVSPGYELDDHMFSGIAVNRDSYSDLDIITMPSGGRSPQDLFASEQMRNLLTKLRGHYDMIVLDTPPVLAVSDARILSALADTVVLVVRWQRTPKKMVQSAVMLLRSSEANLVGTVMTQVQLKELTPADGFHDYAYSH